MESNTYSAVSASADELCYLSAGHVEGPGGTLAGVELCNEDDETVGMVDGVLIDPPARRVRFFVVSDHADLFLLPAESVVSVDPESHIARLESEDVERVPFYPDDVRAFSEEDALTAMFSAH